MKRMGIGLGIIVLVMASLARSTSAQTLTTIYTFCLTTDENGYCTDGSGPHIGAEISPGILLSVCDSGGTSDDGTVFTLTFRRGV